MSTAGQPVFIGLPTPGPLANYVSLLCSNWRGSNNLYRAISEPAPYQDGIACMNQFDQAFGLLTAVGPQLDVLGNIVGQSRTVGFQPRFRNQPGAGRYDVSAVTPVPDLAKSLAGDYNFIVDWMVPNLPELATVNYRSPEYDGKHTGRPDGEHIVRILSLKDTSFRARKGCYTTSQSSRADGTAGNGILLNMVHQSGQPTTV